MDITLIYKNTPEVGKPVDDPVEIKPMVRELLASSNEDRARCLGIWVDHPDASPEEIHKAVAGTFFIKIQPGVK